MEYSLLNAHFSIREDRMPIRAVIFDFGDVLVRTEDPSGQ
jgi:hypothetical protein